MQFFIIKLYGEFEIDFLKNNQIGNYIQIDGKMVMKFNNSFLLLDFIGRGLINGIFIDI